MSTYAVLYLPQRPAQPRPEVPEPDEECAKPGCGKPRYQGRLWCVSHKDPRRR